MSKNIAFAALAVSVLALAISFFGGNGGDTSLGKSLPISNFDAVSVKEFTEGGGVLTISNTDGTETLTQDQMLNNNVLVVAETQGEALTLTLPAATTMTTLIPNAGDKRSWMIENAHTVAATTTTIAAGSGIDLQEPDGQNVVIGINNYAWLTCFREAGATVVCRVDETIPAD